MEGMGERGDSVIQGCHPLLHVLCEQKLQIFSRVSHKRKKNKEQVHVAPRRRALSANADWIDQRMAKSKMAYPDARPKRKKLTTDLPSTSPSRPTAGDTVPVTAATALSAAFVMAFAFSLLVSRLIQKQTRKKKLKKGKLLAVFSP